jgi:DNA-binding LytR/AlgR family response regulator
MLTAIALDDEPIALEVIRSFGVRMPELDIRQFFTNPVEATEYIRENPIDVVFLDIHMPDISGIQWARKMPYPAMIIFTTAYSEHAVESFELDAVDFLLKPFSFDRFSKSVDKAAKLLQLKKQSSQNDHLVIRAGHDKVRIPLADILYCRSAGNYVQFITSKEKHLSRLTMAEAEAMLPARLFVRVHRSYIVPISRIRKLEKAQVWISDQAIPVGAGYFENLEKMVR